MVWVLQGKQRLELLLLEQTSDRLLLRRRRRRRGRLRLWRRNQPRRVRLKSTGKETHSRRSTLRRKKANALQISHRLNCKSYDLEISLQEQLV